MVLVVGRLEPRGELAGMLRMHGFKATEREIRLLGGLNRGPVLPCVFAYDSLSI